VACENTTQMEIALYQGTPSQVAEKVASSDFEGAQL
jgi:hypothetical protein